MNELQISQKCTTFHGNVGRMESERENEELMASKIGHFINITLGWSKKKLVS